MKAESIGALALLLVSSSAFAGQAVIVTEPTSAQSGKRVQMKVQVLDEVGPVSGERLSGVAFFDGQQVKFTTPATNASGITHINLTPQEPGLVGGCFQSSDGGFGSFSFPVK